ncbi:MAG TPA: 2-hydroxyacyl-CoA dehydratase family protein [Smithella sp.]|nr:2-hydroxyacyl-CoA dehydratase [Smithella sp.]MDM7987458.1 2-hydroxyacyl-CoA dehydratase family protein [Smithella sp.]HNY50210.1 2-hydroxyacyl-CoA dehydratase family protein [Smithella sp.]HOG89838.1 2-hydroxyacyl-CoA dehydratase family protein [Smithella sp.]HOU50459.1 2-hydroxyacyl-CoA dehydratase family protein [Smithella sp.]
MMNEFMEASTALNNKHVVQWKQRGKKVVGYTCSYVPDEIFHAAGILPFRIRGFGATDTTIGDTYFGPFICSLPKCMLQLAGEGKFNFLDGAIITPGCDSMRRLDECWRKAGNDIANAIPPFFFHFGVPHKYADYTITWFTEEIRRLIKAVEEHFKVEITDADLNESIHIYNESRTLLDRFEELRTRAAPPFSGEEALAVILAGTTMPREEYNTLLKKFIAEAEKAPGLNDRVRLMLVGSANDDIGLVRVMEGSKALVVADNLCFGSRFYTDQVGVNGDPVFELSKRYLGHNDCPRMYGDYRRRLNILEQKVKKAAIDGVIMQNIRFCDLHGAENGLFERDLEAKGIPCMRLEREYGPLVETGRMKMRVDAFIERIQQRRASA